MTEGHFWRNTTYLALLAVVFFFVVKTWFILLPFLMGLVLAYLIHPVIDWFVGMGLLRSRVVLILYLMLLSCFALALFFLLPPLYRQTTDFFNKLPEFAANINSLVDAINAELTRHLKFLMRGQGHEVLIPFRAEKFVERFLISLPSNILNVFHWGLWVVIVPFTAYFGLSQGRRWMDGLFNLTPSRQVENLLGFISEVNATLGGFIRGQFVDALCVGLATMTGLFILGFDNAVLMGFVTGLLNPVPFLAPVVGGTLTLLIGYFQGASAVSLIGIVCLFALVRLLDDFVFIPFVIGASVKLHPAVMLFAVLAGFEIGGFLGLVFCVPLAAVAKVIIMTLLPSRSVSPILKKQQVVS